MATPFERLDSATISSPIPTFILPSSQDLRPAIGQDLLASSTINGVPDLLRLPLELRWHIFLPLIRADEPQICEHAQTHLPFIIWNGGKREQAPKTGVQLSVLLLNRQIYQELIPLFYSENLIYLEEFFASDPIKILQRYSCPPVFLPRPLHLTCMGRFVKQIGFSVLQAPVLETALGYLNFCDFPPKTDDEFFNGSNRLRLEIDCQELRQHLPNLQLTYVNIFTHPQKPEEKFLLSLIKTLHTLPGRRILVIHGSNREKMRAAVSVTSETSKPVAGGVITKTRRATDAFGSRTCSGSEDILIATCLRVLVGVQKAVSLGVYSAKSEKSAFTIRHINREGLARLYIIKGNTLGDIFFNDFDTLLDFLLL